MSKLQRVIQKHANTASEEGSKSGTPPSPLYFASLLPLLFIILEIPLPCVSLVHADACQPSLVSLSEDVFF